MQNPIQEILRLAEFLNVKLTEEDIAEISDKCSFQKLKLANDSIKDHSWISGDMPDKVREHELLTKKMFRKGKYSLSYGKLIFCKILYLISV